MNDNLQVGMSSTPEIFDVDLPSFESRVVARSREIPVLVDFWASWCGPCQMLTPILTKLVEEYQGGVALAKVNTDVERDLAAQFGIRSLPTVVLFHDGKIVEHFMGVQPESTVKAMLAPFVSKAGDTIAESAGERYATGDTRGAIAALESALQENPGNDEARMLLADLLLKEGADPARIAGLLGDVDEQLKSSRPYRTVSARLYFAEQAADQTSTPPTPSELDEHPDDHRIRYQLAVDLVRQAEYEQALKHLLEIVQRDRKFDNGIAHRAMLKIFDLLGSGELVSRYRGLLARTLN